LPVTKENRSGSHRTLAQTQISSFRPFRKESIVGNPSKDLIETEGAVRTVIETLIDGQEGFRKIGEALQDETLKRHFLDESLKRAEFRGELENILHQEGVKDIHESGSAAGTFIRLFTGLKTVLGAGPHALLNTAEEAEDAAIQAYEDALKKFLPAPIREVLVRQAVHIEASHRYVKTARDASA
jgi:uncharacterized protein (TIGR02284 family)